VGVRALHSVWGECESAYTPTNTISTSTYSRDELNEQQLTKSFPVCGWPGVQVGACVWEWVWGYVVHVSMCRCLCVLCCACVCVRVCDRASNIGCLAYGSTGGGFVCVCECVCVCVCIRVGSRGVYLGTNGESDHSCSQV